MVEQDKITDYYSGLISVIKKYTACWRNGEGQVVVSISDDKGVVEWCVKGGPSERSRRLRDERDE